MQLRVPIQVESQEIARATLHVALPWYTHVYTLPFLSLYPLLAYAYYVRYDDWIKSEEWTFLFCVLLGAGHALSFLVTRWSAAAKTWVTTRPASSIEQADCVRLSEIVPLVKRIKTEPMSYSFNYQRDTYVASKVSPVTFARLPYPSTPSSLYGKNEFNIPIPSFSELFGEHATAPFFVFQIFCVALWCLDEYWYYSLFTLFMLVMFECTVVWQRMKTLTEFRTMSVAPYPIQCLRDSKWITLQTDELLPGDVVSVARLQSETVVPADILLVHGTCIVNEAMLSGESTPLLKESIQLLDKSEELDNAVLFSGTKVLQASPTKSMVKYLLVLPMVDVLGIVLRTGFGTAQGQLRVSANNLESFLFIGFLLIFAIAASWYVVGIERDLKKSKLLLDCVLIITSVVPPELPMELSLAVNASLVALSKFAIFCTEPFRIPIAGRVDVCCFDKTGTITAENLVLEGVAGVDDSNKLKLVDVKESGKLTTLCLAAAHALVRLDDGTIVGDPMEKTTLEALDWKISQGDSVAPSSNKAPVASKLYIRRRFQFSSALKRMSTVSTLPNSKTLVSVKGAPETIKTMLAEVPEWYDETYKWYSRRGSRVLALGTKEIEPMTIDKINKLAREDVESNLVFAGFLVFHCPLKSDAVQTLKMLADSSHRCIMITGDNPLTAAHVARDVEIVDRDVLILDLKENPANERDLVWRTVDETKIIPVDPSQPVDTSLFDRYDICITGAAMKQFQGTAGWNDLVQNTWVYARVSPAQKEYILTSLKGLGYITLMAGDGTNDVGALKQAHIGVALLDGTPEDLRKIAEHQKVERIKKVYETQLRLSARFGSPPPPVPPAIAHLYPDVAARKKNPMEKFDMASITDALANMEGDEDVPQIKLGDASCAAPFTSKLSHVACNVQYLDGIKFGDYQVTVSGMLMSVCFLCISRAQPVEKLSRERPLGIYLIFTPGVIDLDAKFEPSLLNTAIYLLGLSQQVSTFAINFQGRPFREGIRENSKLFWGLVGASTVAFSGSTDFFPELNRWLQIVEMDVLFRFKLTSVMIADFVGCWVIEKLCKYFFADLEPKALVTRGRERREARRAEEARVAAEAAVEKKEQ
ncbi:cation-transporting ATPase [Pisolithus croceorrhizus]|nr:cation-transporting ATPase [Pisolithus croceorrhizus]